MHHRNFHFPIHLIYFKLFKNLFNRYQIVRNQLRGVDGQIVHWIKIILSLAKRFQANSYSLSEKMVIQRLMAHFFRTPDDVRWVTR